MKFLSELLQLYPLNGAKLLKLYFIGAFLYRVNFVYYRQFVTMGKISYLSLSDERANRSWCAKLEALFEDRLARARHQHYGHAVQHSQAGHDRQNNKPEPQEDVDLLIENIKR